MCLIVFAIDRHPKYRLVLAANRDEFLKRKTAAAQFWDTTPHLLGGRDLEAGGSWLGITTEGKLAAITNYRDARQQILNPPSRGRLVADYLSSRRMTPQNMNDYLFHHGNEYDGFNFLYGDIMQLHYFTNRGGSSGPVQPGLHALSNHLLNTGWPKLLESKERMKRILKEDEIPVDALFHAMEDPTPFKDEALPDTGIGPEYERFLSPIFIKGEHYGTRSTTVILVSKDNRITFCEKIHHPPTTEPACFQFTC